MEEETLEEKHTRLMKVHQELMIKITETNARMSMDLSMLSEEIGRVNYEMGNGVNPEPDGQPPLKLVG